MTAPPRRDEFDIEAIDEIIHGRVRLGVMAHLAAYDATEFTALRDKLKTTDGTLSVHLRKLEEAGYIVSAKRLNGRRPVTRISLSASGRKAFKAYLAAIARLAEIGDAP